MFTEEAIFVNLKKQPYEFHFEPNFNKDNNLCIVIFKTGEYELTFSFYITKYKMI